MLINDHDNTVTYHHYEQHFATLTLHGGEVRNEVKVMIIASAVAAMAHGLHEIKHKNTHGLINTMHRHKQTHHA